MNISPAQMEVYRLAARRREKKRKAEIAARLESAWEVAREAAEILKNEFNAKRVVAFGSLVQSERFHLMSDIDIAVWDVRHYFRAVARLLDIDPSFEVNLVPVEDVRPELLLNIEKDGMEL